jgi:hypothetical protein
VQWVEQGSNGRQSVARIDQLPIDPKVTAAWDIELRTRDGKWYASMQGIRPKFMNDLATTDLLFQLGLPGEVRSVSPK